MNSRLRNHNTCFVVPACRQAWRVSCFVIGIVCFASCSLLYAQDDYLEVKQNTKVNTLTFSTFTADAPNWTFPSTPVKGEVFYNFETSHKRPYYFDGTGWKEFMGVDRTIATNIVAASNSLDKSRADYVCDGTDDQQEINTAINNLPATGGAVYLLEGTYNISGAINLNSNTAIIGTGAGTVLRATSIISNVINAQNVNRILLSQFKIDGNNSTGGGHGIAWTAVTYSKIDKVWVGNMQCQGISWVDSSNNIISGSNINSNGWEGINFLGSSNNNIISGNSLQSNGHSSIVFTFPSSNNIISGNNVQSNGYEGINFWGSSNNIVSGNNVQVSHFNALHFASYDINPCYNNIIIGNNLQLSEHSAVRFWGEDNSIIIGNNLQSSGHDAIDLMGSNGNIFSGNVIYDSGGSTGGWPGISLSNSSDNLISSTIFYDPAGDGYLVNLSDDCTNNYLVGNIVALWPTGYNIINDGGTNTQYTDQVKMTLEKRVVTSSSLDAATTPTSYVCLNPSSAITLTLSDGKSAGDLLILENISTNNITVNDSGNVNLSARHILGQYDILKLIWNGSRWLEMCYVDN